MLVLSAVSVRAATNYLANPGFESGTAGWTIVPPWTWTGPSYAVQSTNEIVNGGTAHVSVHGGTNAFKEWGYFQSYATTPGAMQTFPAAAGSTWSADGWVSTQIPDNVKTNTSGVSNQSYLQVLFMDATTNYSSPLASYTSPILDFYSPTNTWLYRQVTNSVGETNLVAPAGTAFVRVQMIFSQPAGYPGGSAYWDDITLLKTSNPDPEITVQPVPVTKVYGQTATFSVTANGQTALTYKWQKDNADIVNPDAYGVNTATLTLSNVTTAMQGNYTVIVTDQAGPLTSNPAYLTVTDPGIISITPPVGQTRTNGGTASISVSASGSSALSFTWLLNNSPISDDGHFSGTTTSNLTVMNLTSADAGTYTVQVNGGVVQASSSLKVVSAAQLATNLLLNPGFEDGVFSMPWETAWAKFNGVFINTDIVHSGTDSCLASGGSPDNGFYQNVPAVAGATYHAGGWFYVPSGLPVGDPASVTLQIMFKNAGNNTLATFVAPAIRSTFAPLDSWTYLQATNATGGTDLVAPAGTVSITCQVYLYEQAGGIANVYIDDLLLQLASLPPPPAVTITPSAAGGMMNLSFPTTTGVIYEVLHTDSLASPINWQTNSTITGNGTVTNASYTIGTANQFYRVLAHY